MEEVILNHLPTVMFRGTPCILTYIYTIVFLLLYHFPFDLMIYRVNYIKDETSEATVHDFRGDCTWLQRRLYMTSEATVHDFRGDCTWLQRRLYINNMGCFLIIRIPSNCKGIEYLPQSLIFYNSYIFATQFRRSLYIFPTITLLDQIF